MKILLFAGALALCAAQARAGTYAGFEGGLASAGHNTVKIPLDGGTRFSLTEDLDSDPAAFYRLRAGVRRGRHDLSFLAAPLTFDSSGALPKAVTFAGETFPAGTRVSAEYRFNSYRVRYLYAFREDPDLTLRWGGALKLRHAGIKLSGGGLSAESRNTGFVPLLAFSADWRFAPGWSALFDLEGLGAPQGRAEDARLALARELRPGLRGLAGYRFLEGGSGAGEVYTFAWIHYFLAGVEWEF